MENLGADGLAVMITAGPGEGRSLQLTRGGPGMRPEAEASDYTFPDLLPPFRGGRNLVPRSGDLWVEGYLPEGAAPTYEVFDPRGVRMGEVELPRGRGLIGFGDGTAYLVRVDDVNLRWLERDRVVPGRE